VTFFQRIRTPFAEGHDDEQARMQPRMRMIGEHLQERREDLGLDLDEIGAMLRIKPSYLAALEQGRTQDLPGPTYAIGFVRAYAEFLGLDAEPVLARFKAEASGVTARPDLALPVPLGERSLPGGALVLVALILALCGYGIWYYLSTDERNRPERVAGGNGCSRRDTSIIRASVGSTYSSRENRGRPDPIRAEFVWRRGGRSIAERCATAAGHGTAGHRLDAVRIVSVRADFGAGDTAHNHAARGRLAAASHASTRPGGAGSSGAGPTVGAAANGSAAASYGGGRSRE
jgi:transcriptional regulator with XRE-family HTH domain